MSNALLRRTSVRRALLMTLAGTVVAGGLVAADGLAVAAPRKTLQSVSVSLGADSSVQAIETLSVRAEDGETPTSDTASLDPAEHAERLPVRILTSYRLGDRSGTDLREIEGESGRVVVDVTVQNTTARPEQLTYDFDGVQRRHNALVATPLTVVASARLGEDSLGDVVTSDDVSPTDVTNGVVGTTGDEAGAVQWAAMLAPPRLGASTTFRLVQDTEDFEVPRFDLTVQPGLVTDTSVRRLLEAAFASDPGSTLQLESSTIELVSSVNAILAGAGGVLAQLQGALSGSAETLGQQTILELESGASLVSTSLTALAGDLDSLNSQMAAEMEKADAETVRQFEQTVASMKQLLGDPADLEDLPSVKPADCREELPRLRTTGSITEQMLAITRQLRVIESATEACRERISEGLAAAIGTADDEAGDDTVIGTLRGTQSQLDAKADALVADGRSIADRFDAGLLGGLGSVVEDVTARVALIREKTQRLGGIGGDTATRKLEELRVELDGLVTDLAAEDGLRGTMRQVNARVVDAQAALGGGNADDAVAQLADAASMVCAINRGSDAVDQAVLDEVSVSLVGQTCAGEQVAPSDYPGDVSTRVTSSLQALETVVALSDMSEGSENDRAFDALEESVLDARDQVAALLEELTADQGSSRDKVAELQAAVDALSTDDVPAWDCTEVPPLPAEGEEELEPLELLVRNFRVMECNQEGLDAAIMEYFGKGESLLRQTSDDLDHEVGNIDGARARADENVDQLVGSLIAALDDSVTSVRVQGRRSVSEQHRSLDSSQARLAGSLDERVADAVRRIDGTVSRSTRNLTASERALVADLNDVLVDLGDRSNNGTGLLGTLVKGAGDTGSAASRVLRAGRTASEFAAVRSTALEDVFLQQAQLGRSLELLGSFPAFGEDVPAGSDHLTVFAFRLGGN